MKARALGMKDIVRCSGFAGGILRLALVLALVVPLTAAGPPSAGAAGWWGSFADDDASPHQAAIEALVTAEITGGCASPSDTPRFCPGKKITRGQMAAFLSRALDLAPAPGGSFTDTSGNPFAADIDAVAAAGISRGCGDGLFCPDRKLTRGEMAALLVQAFATDATPPPGARFVDVGDSPFQGQIEVLADLGVTRGCKQSEQHFCPGEQVSRAQMASFLASALDLPLPEIPVVEEVAPAPVDGTPPADWYTDPLQLIDRVEHQRRFSYGDDHWIVVVCKVPVGSADPWMTQFGSDRIAITAADAAARLQRDAVPYFAWLSEGVYAPVFKGGGVVSAAKSSTDAWSDCEDKGRTQAAGAEGAFVIMDVPYGGGRGGSGWICAPEPCEVDSFLPGSGRGVIVGAFAVTSRGSIGPYLSTVVHEIGHALDFPHSFPAGTSNEYTDPIDMMSGGKEDWEGGPVGTIAANRYAAGWIGPDRATVHAGGTKEYVVGGIGSNRTQLVVVPSGDPDAFTALGAITRSGYDAVQPVEGVTVHRVDQRPEACAGFSFAGCVGTHRRQAPVGPPNRTAHVLQPGQTADLGGVVVTVVERLGTAYRIRVQGSASSFPALVP